VQRVIESTAHMNISSVALVGERRPKPPNVVEIDCTTTFAFLTYQKRLVQAWHVASLPTEGFGNHGSIGEYCTEMASALCPFERSTVCFHNNRTSDLPEKAGASVLSGLSSNRGFWW